MRIANRSARNSGLLAVTVHRWCFLYFRVVIPVAPWCSPSEMVAYVAKSGMVKFWSFLAYAKASFNLFSGRRPSTLTSTTCLYVRKFVCTTRLIVLENASMNQ